MKEPDPVVKIIIEGWKQLDAEVDAIMLQARAAGATGSGQAMIAEAKARARGKAEILAVAMRVGYPLAWTGADADAVSDEAGRRAKMRASGREYGTIGVDASTRALKQGPPAGWALAPDRRGLLRVDGGA